VSRPGFHQLAVAKLTRAGGVLAVSKLTRHELRRILDVLCDAHPKFKTKRGKAWTVLTRGPEGQQIEITAYGWQQLAAQDAAAKARDAGITPDGWQVTVGARVVAYWDHTGRTHGTVLSVGSWCRVAWDNGHEDSTVLHNLKAVTP